MGLNGVYFLINEQTGPQLSLCHMDAYVSYLGACLYPSYFLLFKGRMCNDEFCFLRHNCFVSFSFLFPFSHAVEQITMIMATDWVKRHMTLMVSGFMSWMITVVDSWKKHNQKKNLHKAGFSFAVGNSCSGILVCHSAPHVVIEKNTEGGFCGLFANRVMGN